MELLAVVLDLPVYLYDAQVHVHMDLYIKGCKYIQCTIHVPTCTLYCSDCVCVNT